jgi:hypothetical protein
VRGTPLSGNLDGRSGVMDKAIPCLNFSWEFHREQTRDCSIFNSMHPGYFYGGLFWICDNEHSYPHPNAANRLRDDL